MLRVEEQHHFATPLEEGFRYITDPANWPDFVPGLVRIDPGGRFRQPGDTTALVLRLLGRDVRLDMTLERYEPPHLIELRSVQAGLLPAAHHERVFSEAEGGFDFRIATDYEPRPGLYELLDRVLVRRAVARTLRQYIQNLDTAFAENRASASIPGSDA